MWDLPLPGLERVSPALAGGFLTTVPPGKSPVFFFNKGIKPAWWAPLGEDLFSIQTCSTLYSTSQIFYPLLFYYVFLHSTFIRMLCHLMPTSNLGGADSSSNRCFAVPLHTNNFLFFFTVVTHKSINCSKTSRSSQRLELVAKKPVLFSHFD